ncbi:unnamed protein product [Nyctereutes procyonoides]|uniref:(raccoon dog) hypothetical protein n=1 Tax=Nyctereutes procyonoides TaxID=34880 RepID=A0A811ZXE5_NYCPR|nr:unnamed protein product [Nyctereutes procyonoides]
MCERSGATLLSHLGCPVKLILLWYQNCLLIDYRLRYKLLHH